MGKVMFDMSMSLDGYIAAPNDNKTQPLGDGGERLVDWFTALEGPYANPLARPDDVCGAVIMGRRTYEFSALGGWWGEAGPVGQTPCFVLSHSIPERVHAPHIFSFVTHLAEAMRKAQAVAGDKVVGLMGANVQQQYLNAGWVDELYINIAPVLLGRGTRLLDNLNVDGITLEPLGVKGSPGAAHLAYRVVRPGEPDVARAQV
jgi:dihydrofolate reductase